MRERRNALIHGVSDEGFRLTTPHRYLSIFHNYIALFRNHLRLLHSMIHCYQYTLLQL